MAYLTQRHRKCRVLLKQLNDFDSCSLWGFRLFASTCLLPQCGALVMLFFCSAHHSPHLFLYLKHTSLATPRAFTFSVIPSHTLLLFLLASVENLLLMTSKLCSATTKIIAHSAGVKFAFLAHFAGEGATFSAMLSRR